MSNFAYLLLGISIYLLPGFSFTRLFKGRGRNNLFFWLFWSAIIGPQLYLILALLKQITLYNWVALNLVLLAATLLLTGRVGFDSVIFLKEKVDLRKNWILYLLGGVFVLALMLPRLGLLGPHYPIGDDRQQVRKTISVAESVGTPGHYHFPTAPMTIYYFNNVPPGLMVKFSEAQVSPKIAWFIHSAIFSSLIVGMVIVFFGQLLEGFFERITSFLTITFIGGLEVLLPWWRVDPPLNHLEWWTDWLSDKTKIHFQISSPYTLAFWVPQHLFGGLLVVPFYLLIESGEIKKRSGQVLAALIFSAWIGYSAFTFLTVIAAYMGMHLLRLIFSNERRKSFFDSLQELVPVGVISGLLSLPNLTLYLTGEKESYFSVRLMNFWLLPNTNAVNKFINLVLTVPSYLTVELGLLTIVLVVSTAFFFKYRLYLSGKAFFYLLFLIPFSLLFFIRASDDNNIAMRSTIPGQVALALLAGEFLASSYRNLSKLITRRVLWAVISTMCIIGIAGVATTSFEFWYRFLGQYTESYSTTDEIFAKMNNTLPLNALVFTTDPHHDSVTALGQRLTFKPVKEFDFMDKQHAAAAVLAKWNQELSDPKEIRAFVRDNELRRFETYLLVEEKKQGLEEILKSERFYLYKL